MTAIGIAGVGSLQSAEAGNLPARGGKTDYPSSEPGCWAPNGPTVRNACNQTKYWYMPLISVPAGTFWVTVTASGADVNSNVECASSGYYRNGTLYSFSGWLPLPQFGVATDINLPTSVPPGGSGMVDCRVQPGGKIHTLSW